MLQGAFSILKDDDAFGLRQFEQGDSTYQYYQLMADEFMPLSINDHNGGYGIRVTLLGNTMDEDTMNVSSGAQRAREACVYQAINTRYFEIPDGVEIAVKLVTDIWELHDD